jgi:zinc transporter 7
MNAYVATAIISTVPNLVLFLIPDRLLQSANGMNYMLCFAAGALLGDVFLHTLPHLLTEDSHGAGGHDHDKGIFVGLAVLTGFALFMLVSTYNCTRLLTLAYPYMCYIVL